MAKKKSDGITSLSIKDSLFWKEDFLRLSKKVFVYIKSGKLIFPKSDKVPNLAGECLHKSKLTFRSGRDRSDKWFWCPICGALRECYNANWRLPIWKARLSVCCKKRHK